MTDKILVTTTFDSSEEAERVAQHLVERRLAACAQVTAGVRSHYHWKGKLESAVEWVVTLKTNRARFAALAEELKRVHTYEVPEVVAVPLVDISADYEAWMERELQVSQDV